MGQAHDNGTFMQDAHWSPSKEDVPAEIDKRIMAQCVDPESSTRSMVRMGNPRGFVGTTHTPIRPDTPTVCNVEGRGCWGMLTCRQALRGPPRRHSALFHFLSRQLNHRSPRPPSTSSHHVSDYQPKYQLDNLSADRVYHIGSTANSPVSGDRIDRESVRRRTPQRRRFLHASRMAFPRGITGRRVGPLGLDPPFASPSTANFVAEAVRWRGSRRYQTARAELTACYLDPRLGTYHPVI